MPRWFRLFLAFLFALVVAVPAHAASREGAEPAAARPPEVGQDPAAPPTTTKGAPLVAPHDVPVVLPTARGVIPPIPRNYVTKDLGWLEIAYPPSAGERVASILAEADAVKGQLASALGQSVLGHVTVRVAPTVADMARLAPSDAPPPEYASGVAYHGLHLVLLSMLQPRGGEAVDLDEVFRHELAHVALEDAVQGKHVPVWFNEGLAIQLSGERYPARMQTLWSATLSETIIPLKDLDRSFPHDNSEVSIAYAESADFMRFLTRRSGVRFAALIDRVREGQAFENAMSDAYGDDLHRLEFEWRRDLEHRFSVIPILTGGGLIWVLVIVALGVAYVRRRRRAKAILARWEREEAIEDARLAKLAAERNESIVPIVPTAASVSMKIERDGCWHTLH